MRNIALRGNLSWSDFDKVADALDNYDDSLRIYLFSNGGSISVSLALLDLVNKNREKVIIYGGSINSACFDLFFKAKCSKYIMPMADGMYHQTKMAIDINEDGNPTYFHGAHNKKWLKRLHEETIMFATALKFTPAEIKSLKKGDELYFMEERLYQFLKESKNI